tara:strand:+ start:7469 stop:7609 length:141 start_codon:yes stop_codon:yes gene_type:complete
MIESSDNHNESTSAQEKNSQPQSSSENNLSASEIEKLYLKIKEDWL